MPNGPSEEVVQETVVHGRPSHTWRTVLLSIVVVGSVACTWALSTQFSKTALVIDPVSHLAARKIIASKGTLWKVLG
ncbi:unnamed protein product [Haemonchus placei]|uniref:Conjugal transfer protein TrbI n=1 Tax=Haemonchus placei TaxID=6290 RepID=A0A0N4X802_HAEPC|nr:unnamed protein product [Haemonchus placei]